MKFYSELTKNLYDTADACAAAEAEHLKAEEAKKNSYQIAVQELDDMAAYFKNCQKEQDAAYRKMSEASSQLRKKYADFQRNFGRLPEKHYSDFILTRLL